MTKSRLSFYVAERSGFRLNPRREPGPFIGGLVVAAATCAQDVAPRFMGRRFERQNRQTSTSRSTRATPRSLSFAPPSSLEGRCGRATQRSAPSRTARSRRSLVARPEARYIGAWFTAEISIDEIEVELQVSGSRRFTASTGWSGPDRAPQVGLLVNCAPECTHIDRPSHSQRSARVPRPSEPPIKRMRPRSR